MADFGDEITYSERAVLKESERTETRLEGLYDSYGAALYRYAFSILGSADDAEDAVSEVFIRLARGNTRLKNPAAYLFRAARNASYDILRSRKRRDALNESLAFEIRPADENSVEMTAIIRSFSSLPSDQREILTLKVFEEMSFREISSVMKIPANTAASRYRYAVGKLKAALGDDENGR